MEVDEPDELPDDEVDNCMAYYDLREKRVVCPAIGGEWCDFPNYLRCDGG